MAVLLFLCLLASKTKSAFTLIQQRFCVKKIAIVRYRGFVGKQNKM